MKIKITDKKELYNFSEPYIIAEIGANHNGDMVLAKRIIDAACECGCDAVKFQSWTPQSLISEGEYKNNQKYNDNPKKHWGSLKEMVEKYYLTTEQHFELKTYCDEKNIEFCSTPFSKEEAKLLVELGTPFFKIASMDINNLPLLQQVANFHKPVLLSTGMADLGEIERAVKVIERSGNNKIVLLHCISIYPPAYEDIHLRNILMLQQTFGYPVGFSDHTIGYSIPLAAATLGACVIEKHFTLDKDFLGWDHEISANPQEMEIIVNESKHIVKSLGGYQRVVSEAESQKKLKFRRSIVTNKSLEMGHRITEEDIGFKRPGTGIAPEEAKYIIGRVINKDITEDSLLTWDCFN